MSRIETRARPILEPLIRGHAPPTLTNNNQRRLALWVCLRAYIVEASTPRGHNDYSTHDERIAFAADNQKIPPENAVVWLVMLPDSLASSAYNRLQPVIKDESKSEAFQAYTCFIGKVGFQLVQWKGAGLNRETLINDRGLSRTWQGRCIEIWPNHLAYPRKLPRTLTLSEVMAFVKRFHISDLQAPEFLQ